MPANLRKALSNFFFEDWCLNANLDFMLVIQSYALVRRGMTMKIESAYGEAPKRSCCPPICS